MGQTGCRFHRGELVSGHGRALTVRLAPASGFWRPERESSRDVNGLLEDIAPAEPTRAWPALLSEGCIVLFYTIICCIMLIRPEPISRAEGVGPALLATAGTYAAWLIPLLPRGPELPAPSRFGSALRSCLSSARC